MDEKNVTGTPGEPQPNSLSPVQVEAGKTIPAPAQPKWQRAANLIATGLCSVIAVFAVVQWQEKSESANVSAAAAQSIQAIDEQQGSALLRCVLPDMQRAEIADRSAMQEALENASEREQKTYARKLWGCAAVSEELASRIDALNVPVDLAPSLSTLRGSADEVVEALATYRGYLEDPERPYDFEQATPLIDRIAIAWSIYEDQRASLNQALRDHP